MIDPAALFDLRGQLACVTGAGRGLGRLAAEALAAAGASLVLVGRDRARLDQAAADIRQLHGTDIESVSLDVASSDDVSTRLAEAFGRLGPGAILVNNAGIASQHNVLETSEAEWRQVIDTNLTGAYNMVRAVAPTMVAAGYGRIINIGSVMSGRGAAGRGAYCASKAGIANLGRALAFELGPNGITVNTICPGVIMTDLNREQILTHDSARYSRFVERVAIGRLGEPSDLAAALLFLAGRGSAYVTGQTLYVDGGYTAG